MELKVERYRTVPLQLGRDIDVDKEDGCVQSDECLDESMICDVNDEKTKGSRIIESSCRDHRL